MPATDTIIFDLGGVLIDWNPEYLYRKIFSDKNDLRYFLENICTNAWNQEQDAGYPIVQATAELVAKYPQYDAEIKAYSVSYTHLRAHETREDRGWPGRG